ncbi:MAG: type II secretion system protein [Candidatus Omnitrophota bacterium]|nr:type II secretion system protein [Candidatus Omnitrophota bacterium]
MKRGFTLVELVIVIVILGILATVAMPKFVDLTNQAKNAATQGALGGLRSAISIFYAQAAAGNDARFPSVTDEIKNWMAQGVPANANMATNVNTLIVTTSSKGTSTAAGWVYVNNTANSDHGKIFAAHNTSW